MLKGRAVSAAGWDFGSQAQAVQKYKALCWIEERYWRLQGRGVFGLGEPPADLRLVGKERDAYKSRLEDLSIAVDESSS